MRIEPIEDAIRRRTLGKNWPKLADFERDSVFVPTKIVNDLLYGLRIKRHAILLGTEGRGKSTAAEVLGFRLKQSGDRVYMIDCEYESPHTTDQIGTAIINKDSSATLWIIDGIQLDADGIAALYEYIESTRKARFLFVWTRELPPDIRKIISEEDWLDEVLEKSTVVSMVPTEETIREIITSFVNAHLNERRFADTTFLQNITPEYLSNVLKLTGGNLRTLVRYLQIWDPRTESLDAMGPEQILDSIQEDRLKPLLNVGDDLLRTYVAIAAAYQFDIPVSADAGTPFIIRELEARGLIENSGSAFYRLPHSSDARDVIRAFASMTGKTPSAVTDANLPNDSQLKEWRLSHSLRLMKGLREASWYSPSRKI
ncbi:MAG TPA: hypothetical protein VFI57_06580, partial [Pyrinomonadaceae bacterium]|nr:hypothetical protein [Pyrinomonadaceae bacterium]